MSEAVEARTEKIRHLVRERASLRKDDFLLNDIERRRCELEDVQRQGRTVHRRMERGIAPVGREHHAGSAHRAPRRPAHPTAIPALERSHRAVGEKAGAVTHGGGAKSAHISEGIQAPAVPKAQRAAIAVGSEQPPRLTARYEIDIMATLTPLPSI